MNYENDIRIDENALELEWLEQPTLFMKYARHSAKMRQNLDQAKQNLDIAKAESDKSIRENPEKYGLPKVTEAAITSAIFMHPKYKTAYEDYLEAKYESDMASNAVTAFEQRKSALENLVKLFGMQYFAGPTMPRDISWEREQKQKSSNEGVAKKLQRSK